MGSERGSRRRRRSSTSSSSSSEFKRSNSRERVRNKILSGVRTEEVFGYEECKKIEEEIEKICVKGGRGDFKPCTVDEAPLRNKYFFGEGYIYGNQVRNKGPGNEKLFPKNEVDPIPSWIYELVERPIVNAGIIPEGFVNSAVINVYLPGGCIVSHIDPPHIFDRPIVTASFLSDSALSFGCRFSFRPMRTTKPVLKVAVNRGTVLSMEGFAADGITHCIRPEDVKLRRAVIILRHVPDTAPRLTHHELKELRLSGILTPRSFSRISRRSYSNFSSSPSPSRSRSRSSGRSRRERLKKAERRCRHSSSSSPSPLRDKKIIDSIPDLKYEISKFPVSKTIFLNESDSENELDDDDENLVKRDSLHKRLILNTDLKTTESSKKVKKKKKKTRRKEESVDLSPCENIDIKTQLEEYNKVLNEIESLEKRILSEEIIGSNKKKKTKKEQSLQEKRPKESKREREKRLRQQLKARLRRNRLLLEKREKKRKMRRRSFSSSSSSDGSSSSSSIKKKSLKDKSKRYTVQGKRVSSETLLKSDRKIIVQRDTTIEVPSATITISDSNSEDVEATMFLERV